MKLESIAEYLQDKGRGISGKTMFVGRMPSEKFGILLRESLGGMPIDYNLPGYRKGRFIVAVRSKKYAEAKELIDNIQGDLTILQDDTTGFPGMHVKYVLPRHDPIDYPTSVADEREFVLNIDICYVII